MRQKLEEKWKEIVPAFKEAREPLYNAKNHDDIYTDLWEEGLEDEAAYEVEGYGIKMEITRTKISQIRLTMLDITVIDDLSTSVQAMLEMWDSYYKLFKNISGNYS